MMNKTELTNALGFDLEGMGKAFCGDSDVRNNPVIPGTGPEAGKPQGD
jgi:hypothetical protein